MCVHFSYSLFTFPSTSLTLVLSLYSRLTVINVLDYSTNSRTNEITQIITFSFETLSCVRELFIRLYTLNQANVFAHFERTVFEGDQEED